MHVQKLRQNSVKGMGNAPAVIFSLFYVHCLYPQDFKGSVSSHSDKAKQVLAYLWLICFD